MKTRILFLMISLIIIIGGVLLLLKGQTGQHPGSTNNTSTPGPSQTMVPTITVKTWSDFKYITPVDWPPKVRTENGNYSCTTNGDETSRAGRTEEQTIDGKKYCVTVETDGAAGSIYKQYAYVFRSGTNMLKTVTFSIRQVQCGNYPEPKMSECQNERNSFDITQIIVPTLENL